MPNPGWWETAYDRLRGKEQLGGLQPLPAPTPGVTAEQPDPAYTPKRNPINALGERIMGVVEDPRNAWIGLGPIGMATKIPKAAKAAGETIGIKVWDEMGRQWNKFDMPKSVGSDPYAINEFVNKQSGPLFSGKWAVDKTYVNKAGETVIHARDDRGKLSKIVVEIGSVEDDHAAEVIGELAYKYPDSSNDELIRLGRERHQVALTKDQVARTMAELRNHEKMAWQELNPDPNATLGRSPMTENIAESKNALGERIMGIAEDPAKKTITHLIPKHNPPAMFIAEDGTKYKLVGSGKWITRDTGISFRRLEGGKIRNLRLPYATYKRGDSYIHLGHDKMTPEGVEIPGVGKMPDDY